MRSILLTLAAALVVVPALQAQDRPANWTVRTDRPDQSADDVEFVDMAPGWHITTGPAAILYDAARTATGEFRIESEIYLFDPGQRREAFGIVFGGSDLDGSGQRYSYFLIRQTGEYIIKNRRGADAPTVRNWTGHSAIVKWADRAEGDETVKNVLAVEAGANEVRFLVNGQAVASVPRSELSVDGIVGLRVNHALNLHVTTLEVTPR